MQLTILYTANLRGDLDLLPRLFTWLRRLKQASGGRVLLLDAGNACADDAWHCTATGGRSTLLVLDAMGYQAANVTGFLTAAGRQKLADNVLALALVDERQAWQQDDVLVVAADDGPTQPCELCIVLAIGDATRLDGNTLHLASVQAGQVGMVVIGQADDKGRLALVRDEIIIMPVATLPDPTIAATVEFVLGEARYYARRK